MRNEYLGDSYDLVKRFWAESLASVGQLFAHPKFIPTEIRSDYTAVTGISILGSTESMMRFGILFDPDTGIPLPTEHAVPVSTSHAPLSFIAQEMRQLKPAYAICFDQSHHRKHQLDRLGQRDAKVAFLRQHGFDSFYYVSHAPFLFVSSHADVMKAIRLRLLACGIPQSRFEPTDSAPSAHTRLTGRVRGVR
jgi:hypothetical protein